MEGGGLSAPIAASVVEGADVIVAGFDVAAKAIRMQRINPRDEITMESLVFADLRWSSESNLAVVPAARGVAVTWRGLRAGRLVRQMVSLGPDLRPIGEPVEVTASSCATRDALWFQEKGTFYGRPWSAPELKVAAPRDAEASLLCGAHRAFALLEDDGKTSLMALGANPNGHEPIELLKEADFGEDESRERAEYTVNDDLGVVRLATSGALAVSEARMGAPAPLPRRLKSTIPADDDVVAVDASPRTIVIVFTEDVGDACSNAGSAVVASTRVKALRVDRDSFAESIVELSGGNCGHEVGPFFTGAVGDSVSVAWVERATIHGKARAPILGLASQHVGPSGPVSAPVRLEQASDALVDAGCDERRCYAVALTRRPGMDAMVPGVARVLRYHGSSPE